MLELVLDNIDVAVQTSLGSLDDTARSEVEEELSKLREDKSLLEGKIRGYLTLSEICQEYKDELNRLKQEYEKLLVKVQQQQDMTSEHLSNESPTPDDDLGNANRHDLEQRNINESENTDKREVNLNKTQTENFNINKKDIHIRTSELFDPGPEQPKSSEGSKSIPMQSLEAIRNDHLLGSNHEKFPMQESMALSSHSQLNPSSLTGLGFEHISDNMPLGESAGAYRNGSADLMVFASFAENGKKKKQDDSEINEMITSLRLESGDNSKILQTVSKHLEKKELQIKKLTHMNTVLIEKNSQLQRAKKDMEKERQIILDKVQRLEKQIYELSTPSNSHSQQEGWVKVDMVKEDKVQKSTIENVPAPKDSKSDLQEQNKQLRDANQKWSQEWDKLRKHFESRISDLQTERDRVTKENTEMRIKEDAKERDYEKMIMNAKKKSAEEEIAKEDALFQLTTANNRLDAMNTQYEELQDELSRMRRDKQSIETEVNILRQTTQGHGGNRVVETPLGSSSDKIITDLKNETYVLRQQLLVFQEDFDKERQDRATAQSIKEDFKKQNDSLKKRARHVEMKNANLERQLKTAEDNGRRTQADNNKLQQQLCDLTNQLQRERENRAIPQYTPPQPVVQSAGFYHQQPHQMFGQTVWPRQHQPPRDHPPSTQYQHRVNDYNRNGGGAYMPTPNPLPQTRNPIYPTNQAGQETEMLVGAWACSQCTYKNYPGRTVCEMCGYIQSPISNQQQYRIPSGPLTPRGEEQQPGYARNNPAWNQETQQPIGMTGS